MAQNFFLDASPINYNKQPGHLPIKSNIPFKYNISIETK